ncbi:MAG: glycosyltransferase, partial [Flavobacteriales bacterium]
ISQFIQEGNTVEIACSENQESFFKTKFPSLKIHVTLPNNHIQIESGKGLFFKLGLRVFEFRSNWKKEKKWVNKHLESNSYDVIYSDNRYGFYNPNVHSVLLTHQLNLPGPKLLLLLPQMVLNKNLNRFNEIEIPDFNEEPKLSGNLSRTTSRVNATFIGPLSQIRKNHTSTKKQLLLILSGPEPQRSRFAKDIVEETLQLGFQIVVAGESQSIPKSELVKELGYCNSAELEMLMNESSHIVCRSGYSTLMELATIGKKALLIPTSGQFEQEYLAKYWEEQFNFPTANENEISTKDFVNYLNDSTHFERR